MLNARSQQVDKVVTRFSGRGRHVSREDDDPSCYFLFFQNTQQSSTNRVRLARTENIDTYFRISLTPTLFSCEKNMNIWSVGSWFALVKKLSWFRLCKPPSAQVVLSSKEAHTRRCQSDSRTSTGMSLDPYWFPRLTLGIPGVFRHEFCLKIDMRGANSVFNQFVNCPVDGPELCGFILLGHDGFEKDALLLSSCPRPHWMNRPRSRSTRL